MPVPDSYGPTKEWVLTGAEETTAGPERFDPADINEGWPSEKGRLAIDVPWEEIIAKGEPWTDEHFPPGP